MYEVTRRKMLKMAAAAALSSYRIFDPHVHVWKHDARYPFAPGAKVPDFDATPEMLLDLMKANGVAKTVIIQVIILKIVVVAFLVFGLVLGGLLFG